MLHFSSPKSFSNYFLRHQGQTPGEYRSAHRSVKQVQQVSIRW
jgi:AraC-like DNA-binding protein